MVFTRITRKIQAYGVLVMFSHTIFSLSFAAVSMLIAASGLPSVRLLFWIMVCFLAARTGANAINRVIDAKYDAMNPRTRDRQIPQGQIKPFEAIALTGVCFALLLFGAYQINWLCFLLSPLALFLLATYSYTKRYSPFCHLYLGLTTACAPMGAWLAVTGRFDLIPLVMSAANLLWVAGFDIIYGAQDVDFDRRTGLHSIPARYGVRRGLEISRFFHLLTLVLFLLLGLITPSLGLIYYTGLVIIAFLFFQEYRLVSPDNLKHVNFASYNINQLVSITLLIFASADVFI